MSEVLVGELAQIADGDHRIYRIGDFEVGVFRRGDALLAWENRCPHAGGPVCQGKIFRRVEEALDPDKKSLGLRFGQSAQIVCPWHGFEFDVTTGRHPGDPKMRLRAVRVTTREGRIYIRPPR